MFNSEPIKHETCLWTNNHEFCLEFGYWDTDETTTKAKLKADMENALGITILDSDCTTSSSYVSCKATQHLDCSCNDTGKVRCDSSNYECEVNVAPSNSTFYTLVKCRET